MATIPDVIAAAPKAYSVLMENDQVRVMEVKLKPGEIAPMHNHPNAHVVIVKNDARLKLSFPDGKDNTIDLKAGQTMWLEAGPHQAENAGTTNFDNLVIEIKK
jgi:quercetin dioxygenase-like cupin family protein